MTADIPSRHMIYRPDIDGLRAIAVILVVGYHLFPKWFPFGFLGVDIFFVISGFLISNIIYKDLESNRFAFTTFYKRRIQRIFPALMLILLASTGAGFFFLFDDELKALASHILGATTFTENFRYWRESGYFDTSAETKPLLHLWSLALEEQFYFIWPLLLFISWKKRLNYRAVVSSIGLLSFFLNIYTVQTDPFAAFYLPHNRFWELLLGSILVSVRPSAQSLSARNVFSTMGSVLILLGIYLINNTIQYPGWWALLPTIGTSLIIFGGPSSWINYNLLSKKLLVGIGLISYPLYLWHWPLFSLARIINGAPCSLEARMGVLLISLALAWLTYRFVEKKLRRSSRGKTIILILVSLLIIFGILGTFIQNFYGFRLTSMNQKLLDSDKWPDGQNHYGDCMDHAFVKNSSGALCKMNVNTMSQAVLIGDSHAGDKALGIINAEKEMNWRVYSQPNCMPLYGIIIQQSSYHHPQGCDQRNKQIIEWISKTKEIKIVALTFASMFTEKTLASWQLKSKDFKGESLVDYIHFGLNQTINILEGSGKKVIFLIDQPPLKSPVRDCIRNPLKSFCTMTRSEVHQHQLKLRQLISRLKEAHPHLVIIDPTSFFCPEQGCRYEYRDTLLYQDSEHLSVRGQMLFGEYFSRSLRSSEFGRSVQLPNQPNKGPED